MNALKYGTDFAFSGPEFQKINSKMCIKSQYFISWSFGSGLRGCVWSQDALCPAVVLHFNCFRIEASFFDYAGSQAKSDPAKMAKVAVPPINLE